MENEELRGCSCSEDQDRVTGTPEEASAGIGGAVEVRPEPVENVQPEESSGASPLQGVGIDEEMMKTTSRLTSDYLKMLEEQEKEMRKAAEADPLFSEESLRRAASERLRESLRIQMDRQKEIIEQNRHAWFGKKRKARKEAERKLAELEAQYASVAGTFQES